MRREPEVPEAEVPAVERLDGLARITSKELAITHFVKNGTLQNACSTRPSVVADLGKSARMHIVRLMNNQVKGPKKNDDKSAVAMLKKNDWHENVWQPVVNRDKSHERSGRPECSKGDNSSFRHDINKRAKTTQPKPSPHTRKHEPNAHAHKRVLP